MWMETLTRGLCDEDQREYMGDKEMLSNPFWSESRILRNNTMAADTLYTPEAKTSIVMIITWYNEQLLSIHQERFQLPFTSGFFMESIENANLFLCFRKWIQHNKYILLLTSLMASGSKGRQS